MFAREATQKQSFELLLACCRWPADPAAVATLAAGVDQPAFLALARRHRVQGLAHRALVGAGVTGSAATALAGDARRIATDNLRLAAEAVRLHRRLAAAEVPTLLLKGVALGRLAYRDLGVKMGWDIDLLIAPDRLDAAAAVLDAAGYRNVLPGPAVALAEWHRFAKDSVWRHGASGAHVELHTRLFDIPTLLPGINARSPPRAVELSPGLAVLTLPPEAQFAYLCTHGAVSGWRRLKWLADLAALLGQESAADTKRSYEAACALGAGRAAGQALLLAQRFFGLKLEPALPVRLAVDRPARLLAWLAARGLSDPRGHDDPGERVLTTLPVHLAGLILLPGWRARWAEARRRLRPDPRVGGSAWVYPARVLARRWQQSRSAGA